jgi:hypothetical protein
MKRFSNNIKNLKPKSNSKYHQGIVPQRFLTKYFTSCKNEPVIYRSGLEYQFIQFCENNPKIKKWASEPIAIKYFSRLENKECNYYPDYVLETDAGTHIIVEIKPENQTIKPDPQDSAWLKEQWVKNTDKWKYAQEFANEHNAKFIIVTERFFK